MYEITVRLVYSTRHCLNHGFMELELFLLSNLAIEKENGKRKEIDKERG